MLKDKVHFQPSHHLETPPKDGHDDHKDQNPFHKSGKMIFLILVWIMMVSFLASTPEKHLETRQLAIPIAEPRIYNFTQIPSGTRINATLSGAFLPYETNIELYHKRDFLTRKSMKVDDKDKENYIRVYLQTNTERMLTTPKIYGVTPPHEFDLTKPSKIPIMFDIGEDNFEMLLEENIEILQLVIQSNFTKTPEEKKREMPLMFTYDISPINRQIGVIFAAFVLIFLYVLIIWEVKDLDHK